MNRFRYGLILGMILVVIVWFAYEQRSAAEEPEPLSAAMLATGAKAEELSVNGWARLPLQEADEAYLERVVTIAMDQLGFTPADYQVSRSQNRQQQILRAEVTADHFHGVVAAKSIRPVGSQQNSGVYVVINIETKPEQNRELLQWHAAITGILKNFGGSPRISSCLVGWLNGKLKDGDWNERLENGLAAAKGTAVDRTRYTNFASYTGFSPAISDFLQVGSNKVNLNLAMRYSPYDDRTYVIVGSPVITREY